MRLGFGQSSLRRVGPLLISKIRRGVKILLVAHRGIGIVGIVGILVDQLATTFSGTTRLAYLDVGLNVDLDLGGSSVRHGEHLTL